MIGVEKIEITRAEGASHEAGDRIECASYVEAAGKLAAWALTAPRNGGYHKCDFTITFEDGETYSGRYDLEGGAMKRQSLRDHVRGVVGVTSGLIRPAWMDDKTWERSRAFHDKHGHTETWRKLAENYDTGVIE